MSVSCEAPALGLLVHQGGGCLSPRVREFLCFADTPRSVLGEDGDDELPFYVLSEHQVQQQQRGEGLVQCPALWVDQAAVDAGVGMLQVVYRLGGNPRHCPLPLKPVKLQPVKKAGPAAQLGVACKAYVSGKVHTHVYRLLAGLFPKLERLHHELCSSPAVHLVVPGQQAKAPSSRVMIVATPNAQGVLLEGPSASGEPARLNISINFNHACLELHTADCSGGQADTCLRTVNCLKEAIMALRGEAGPPLQASPVKPSKQAASPAKPPLRPASMEDAVRQGVALVESCDPTSVREGAALLSAAAGDPGLTEICLRAGALGALVTAASTTQPTSVMGMAELRGVLVPTLRGLLDSAPPALYGAGSLVGMLAAALHQQCSNPLLLCQFTCEALARWDVQAEAMRQGLAGAISYAYLKLSASLQAAATPLTPQPAAEGALAGQAAALDGSNAQQPEPPGAGVPASHVARMVAAYNQMSDSGSEAASPTSTASPGKGSPSMRSPSALSFGSFKVPRLQLPSDETSANPVGGLTRSTRRAMSNTPGGRRSPTPTPWGSPTRQRGGSTDQGELSAAAQMAVVAGAIGESLIAADLPSIIAHKRRVDVAAGAAAVAAAAAGAPGAEDRVPAELLEPPVLAQQLSARKPLEAHKILITARSLKSVETSTSLLTDSEAGARAAVATLAVDIEELKCYLLRALLLALPLMDAAGYPEDKLDPAPVLAAELLSMLGNALTQQQEQLRQLAMQTLRRLSQRPRASASPSACHPLVAAAGAQLYRLLNGAGNEGSSVIDGSAAKACQLLHLVSEYVEGVEAVSAAAAVMQHCLPGLQSLVGVLLAAAGLEPSDWPTSCWQLFHGLVSMLGPVCSKVEEAEAGRSLLGLLLADRQTASLLANVADHLFLEPSAGRQHLQAYRNSTPSLQRDLLRLFTGLAGLIGRQPALPAGLGLHRGPQHSRAASRMSMLSIASAVDEQDEPTKQDAGKDLLLGPSLRRGLTRKHALQFFAFLVNPNAGLAQRLLDDDLASATPSSLGTTTPLARSASLPPSSAHIRLRQGMLELLKALFAAPGSPFAADKATSDFYVRLHFIQFLKLYHNPQRDHQALFLCRQHLDMLQVLAAHGGAHTRNRFQQLSVLDFFVRELSLELEAQHPGRRQHMLRMGSAFSGAASDPGGGRRASGASSLLLGSEHQSGHSSPAMSLVRQHDGTASQQQQQQQQQASAPVGVPALRLPGREGPVPQQQQQQGLGMGLGRAGSGQAVPRLNLGAFGGALPSPRGDTSTPSPTSSRLGRPPLPPSARAGIGGTPRMSSRLGRMSSARSVDRTPTPPPTVLPDSKQLGRAGGATFNIAVDARAGAGGADSRPAVPRLGLGGLIRSNQFSSTHGGSGSSEAAKPPAPGIPALLLAGVGRAQAGGSSQASSRHSAAAADSEADSSDEEDREEEEEEESREAAGGAVGGSEGGGQRQTPLQGMDLPAGFAFSGDLEEDLDRLEALEQESDMDEHLLSPGNESGSESASPTIPALRSTPFQQPPMAVPRLALAAAKPPSVPGGLPAGIGLPAPAQPQRDGLPVPVPRLSLTAGMHSNLEQRTASAELAVAAEAEAARRQAGRSFFGDLERSALGKGKLQAATVPHQRAASCISESGDLAADLSFAEERRRRLLYRDEELHLSVLQLVFTLLFDGHGQLDRAYCDPYPWERKLQNVPFALTCHLNHDDNRGLLPRLLPRVAALGPPAQRLLRTLCSALFRPEWYAARWRLSGAAGAYATIYRCQLPAWAGEGIVVLKQVDMPQHVQDRCSQVEVQEEVAVLQALADSPHACQLHDYGLDPGADALLVVLRNYRCSLKQWRARQSGPPAGHLRLYYSIFSEVLRAVQDLLARSIVHFDLKCDNVLLEPLPGVSAAEFWAPSSERLPFRVVLADFGESRLFPGGLDGAGTARARGTDCFKSPEMLLIGGASHKDQCSYDRRRRAGAGPASDIWSLGCLLYELVAGGLLFSDADWLQLLARVTSPGMPLITEEKAAEVAVLPGVLDLLRYMLVRDARMRPTLQDVQSRLSAIMHSSRLRLPPHSRSSAGCLLPSARSEEPGRASPSPLHMPPSPGMRDPLPLLAALPVLPGLVLAPVAAVQRAAELRRQGAQRVVILARPGRPSSSASAASRAGPLAAISNTFQQQQQPAGGQPASMFPPTGLGSRGSSPQPSARHSRWGLGMSTSQNPLFSPSVQSTAGSAGGYTSARTLGSATPRAVLRLSQAAVHPEENLRAMELAAAAAAAAAAGPGSGRQLHVRALHLGRVHPAPGSSTGSSPRTVSQPHSGRGHCHDSAASSQLAQQQAFRGAACLASEDAALQRVLADAALLPVAQACSAVGADCRVLLASGAATAAYAPGMQQAVLLERWLARALPLLLSAEGGDQGGQVGRVVLAVAPGCEPEAALACVACLMQSQGLDLFSAMVAASQWGIDLHLQQHHLAALQALAASSSGGGGGEGRH